MLQILVFGQLTDVIGGSDLTIEFATTVSILKENLLATYPNLKTKTFAIAVNNKVADDDTLIQEGSTIALLPPFSGG